MSDRIGDRNDVGTAERFSIRQHLVRQDAQGKKIRFGIQSLAAHLLGRHVGRRSELPDVLRQHRGFNERDAEVRDFRGPVVRHQDVRGLDVPMDDPLRVGGVQSRRDLTHDRHGFLELQARLDDDPLESRAGDELHDDEHLAGLVVLADVEHADDVRVVDAAQRPAFARESFPRLSGLLRGQPPDRMEHLDGDRSMDDGILGAVDDSHRSPSDGFEQDVASDVLLGRRHFFSALRDSRFVIWGERRKSQGDARSDFGKLTRGGAGLFARVETRDRARAPAGTVRGLGSCRPGSRRPRRGCSARAEVSG